VFSAKVPACPDLLTIGAGTVVRSEVAFYGYRAEAGCIRTGRIQLGRDVVVGDASVLDIDVAMGNRSQLGHASCLHTRQVVPAGERWHGSPARPTSTDFRLVEPRRCGALRRVGYSCVQLAVLLGLLGPVGIGLVVVLLTRVPYLTALLGPGNTALLQPAYHRDALLIAVDCRPTGGDTEAEAPGVILGSRNPVIGHDLLEPVVVARVVVRAVGLVGSVARLAHDGGSPQQTGGSIRDTGSRRRQRTWPSRSSGVPRRRAGAGAARRPGAPGARPVHLDLRPRAAAHGTLRNGGADRTPARPHPDKRPQIGTAKDRRAPFGRAEGAGHAETQSPLPGPGRGSDESGCRPGRVLGGNAVLHHQQW